MEPVAVQHPNAKGKRKLIADTRIRPGTKIFTERPIMRVHTGIRSDMFDEVAFFSAGDRSGGHIVYEAYRKLTGDQSKQFARLPFKEKFDQDLVAEKGQRRDPLTYNEWTCLSKCHVNAVEVDKGKALPEEEKILFVFATAQSINHSCKPNAIWKWNPDLQEGVVHALNNIRRGTEITIDYLAPIGEDVNTSVARRALLKERFNFDCKCKICSGSVRTPEGEQEEARRLYQCLLKNSWPEESDDQTMYGFGGMNLEGQQSTTEGDDYDCSLETAHRPHKVIRRAFDEVLVRYSALYIRRPELLDV